MTVRGKSLEQVDLEIIDLLVECPRASYSDLAGRVGLSPGAAKTRADQLRESRCVRIVRVDPTVLGYGLFAFASIEVNGNALKAAHDLGDLHEASFFYVQNN